MIKFDGGYHTTDVAITSDGKHLLITGSNSYDRTRGLFAAYDLTTDPLTRVDPTNRDTPFCMQVVALPDPELAFLHRVDSGELSKPRTQGYSRAVRRPGARLQLVERHVRSVSRFHPMARDSPPMGTTLPYTSSAATGATVEMDYTTSVGTFSHDAARVLRTDA